MLKSKKSSVGIFGGSFDPPHKGHVKISKISLKELKLKKLIWIITKKNPFKNKSHFSLNKRIIQSKEAVKKLKNTKVLYLDKKIKSARIIHVVNYLSGVKKYKDLYLIIGSDNLLNFHKWTSWKKIAKIVKLVVFSRKGYDDKIKKAPVMKYLNKKIIFMRNKHINISSTQIKRNILKNI
tara:strand:+ start:49 stop:588 length:540 start_codon:yes stop_codon:yes gene_type:complete